MNISSLIRAILFNCFRLLYLTQDSRAQVFNVSEYFALQTFHDATGGESWTYGAGDNHWNFSDSNPCLPSPWAGLTCSPGNVSVTEINLSGYNLTGTLPADVFVNLTGLTTLFIGLNNIFFYRISLLSINLILIRKNQKPTNNSSSLQTDPDSIYAKKIMDVRKR